MTRAPANLLAVRRLLLDHLNIDETRVRSSDLEPAEVGIVGDPAHRGGYHCGSDRVVTGDYSVVESSRDRTGLTLDAAGLDVGLFEVTTRKGTFDLHHFSTWCVAQCVADTPDSRDLREIIYSPDGRVVRRWDRLGRRTSGDDSHLWHTHFSFFRDSIKAGRDQTPLFRRYLTTIGLITPPAPRPAPTTEDPDMQLTDKLTGDTGRAGRTVDNVLTDLENLRNWLVTPVGRYTLSAPMADSPLARLLAFMGRDFTDEPAIVTGVLAGLDPAAIAAAIPTAIAAQVADELAARLAGAAQGQARE